MPLVEVEVLLDHLSPEHLKIRLTEDAEPRMIPRYGVKIIRRISDPTSRLVTLSLPEHLAIARSLV